MGGAVTTAEQRQIHHDACSRSGAIERSALTLFGLLFVCGLAAAQASKDLAKDVQATLWACSCMACRGTDGKAEGTGIPIGWRSAAEPHTILLDYKTDKLQGTVMRQYAGLPEYVPDAEIESADTATRNFGLALHGKHKADVLNLIPPQPRPGPCAGAPGMPKSGHMANQEAEVCASAVARPAGARTALQRQQLLQLRVAVRGDPCGGVYRYDAATKTRVAAPGAGGLSAAPSASVALFAMAWATDILNDTLG